MLIVALDPPLDSDIEKWIEERYKLLNDIVSGFKIGLPAIVKYGANWLNKLFKNYGGLSIADFKLADVGDIMALTTRMIKDIGFNTVIAHAFVGYKQGLEILAKICEKEGMKLVLVVSMSHEGSTEFIDKHIDEFISLAESIESWGIVAPATRLNVIKYIRSRITSTKILSPGVGTQGAEPGTALCAGADYEIIGRLITHSENVRTSALAVLDMQKKRLSICRG